MTGCYYCLACIGSDLFLYSFKKLLGIAMAFFFFMYDDGHLSYHTGYMD